MSFVWRFGTTIDWWEVRGSRGRQAQGARGLKRTCRCVVEDRGKFGWGWRETRGSLLFGDW